MKEEWIVWRVVLAKIATYTEISESWSIDDVLKANGILDLQDFANRPPPAPKGK